MFEVITQFLQEQSGTFNIILSLIVVFQWLDRRSRGKGIENSLVAMKEMSKRLAGLSEKDSIHEKSSDLVSVINSAINTIDNGRKHKKIHRNRRKQGKI